MKQKYCPRYYDLKRNLQYIEEIRRKKKGLSKADKLCLSAMEESDKKDLKELKEIHLRNAREDKRIRKNFCQILKIFIENWDKYDETDLNIVLNTVRRDNSLREFVLKWDSMVAIDSEDPLNKIMKLAEWLESRYDIYDFCHFPEALLDLKEEYIGLKRPDFREWTLKKFIACYKEFLITELRKVRSYEQQDDCEYVKEKIKATRLGEYSPYAEDMLFSNFVDIAIDIDIEVDELPEFLIDDDTPNYLRPKCVLRKLR